MYYVEEVYINDQVAPIRGLVDTGSAFLTTKKSIADKLGLLVQPNTVNIHVYGNARLVISCGNTQTTSRVDEIQ